MLYPAGEDVVWRRTEANPASLSGGVQVPRRTRSCRGTGWRYWRSPAGAVLYRSSRTAPVWMNVRAVTQNRAMAACGAYRARWMALAFRPGSGIAGLGGVALSQLGNVGLN